MIIHPFDAVFDGNSRILILGSFPSVKSREAMFFYGHPQNRFWRVTASVFDEKTPVSIEEKRDFLLRNRIAVWDAIAECDIVNSSDASIKNAVANDIGVILETAKIEKIFTNGRTAGKLYAKLIEPNVNRSAIVLPSTSPANAAWKTERLIEEWKIIKE